MRSGIVPRGSLGQIALLLLSILRSGQTAAVPVYDYVVLHVYPHDPQAFTEGLFYRDGFLYESTGLEGRSNVRKVRLETGEVLQQRDLPAAFFGEGIVDWHDQLLELTWRSELGFVIDLHSFAPQRQWRYQGEGWALTRNDRQIFMSDGSDQLRVLDPASLQERARIRVTADGEPVTRLNELEWVRGQIWANIWMTDRIARIDPNNGHVVGWIDLSGLLRSQVHQPIKADVLNGIAYDSVHDRLFVTGKLWPYLFEILVIPRRTF
jgi:glutaminyl-peptide cyclotransferase